jgi:hypothetical protein
VTPTVPGTVVIQMGNQSGTTLISLDDPAREVTRAPGAESSDPPPRAKRKYQRRHLDKQRHEAHEDKQQEVGSDGEE